MKLIIIYLFVCLSVSSLIGMDLYTNKQKDPVVDKYLYHSERIFEAIPDSGKYYALMALNDSENSYDSAYSFEQLGKSYVELGHIDSGFVYLNYARALFKDIDYSPGLINVFTDLGQTSLQYGIYEKSKEYYQKALAIKSKELKEDLVLMDIFYHLAILESVLGHFESSFAYYEKIMQYYKSRDYKKRYINTTIEYAKTLTNNGQYKKSSKILLTTVNDDDNEYKNDVFSQLAINQYYLDNLDSAVYFSKRELKHCITKEDSLECLSNLSAYYIFQNNFIDADKCYQQAMHLHIPEHSKVHINLNQIEVLSKLKKKEEAVTLFNSTANLILDSNMTKFYENLIDLKDTLLSNGIILSFNSDRMCRALLRAKSSESHLDVTLSQNLINTIDKADYEIKIRDKEIKLKHSYNIALSILVLLLIFSLVLVFYKHAKLKQYLNSLKESYSIVSVKVNNDLRTLLHNFLALEEEIGSVFSVKDRLEKDIIPLLDDIKSLLDVLSKQLLKKHKSKEK